MSNKTAVQEKPLPKKCVCGKEPVLVSIRGGRMYSCRNPMKCCGNLRTVWHKSEILAVNEWNSLVAGFAANRSK